MSADPKPTTPQNEAYVAEQARQCLEISGGNSSEATDALLARLHNDDALYQALGTPLLRRGCLHAIHAARSAERRKHWHAEPVITNDGPARLSRATRARIADLLDYPLTDGSRLGDADKDRVVKEQAVFASQAEDLQKRARWFGLIADRMEPGQTVGSALSADELDALMDKAGR